MGVACDPGDPSSSRGPRSARSATPKRSHDVTWVTVGFTRGFVLPRVCAFPFLSHGVAVVHVTPPMAGQLSAVGVAVGVARDKFGNNVVLGPVVLSAGRGSGRGAGLGSEVVFTGSASGVAAAAGSEVAPGSRMRWRAWLSARCV